MSNEDRDEREIKNPEKKKSEPRAQTSAEKIQSVMDRAPQISTNFFLVIYEADTVQFRSKRQSISTWGIVLARKVLRQHLESEGIELEESLSRKATEELAAAAKATGLPYFLIDFPNEGSRHYYFSTNLSTDRDAAELVLAQFDAMIDVELRKWHRTNLAPPSPRQNSRPRVIR